MIDKEKLAAEAVKKIETEAHKSDALFTELFTQAGLKPEVAAKLAKTLTDLSMLSRLLAQMGIPIDSAKNMMAMELQRYINGQPDVQSEMTRVFSDPKGFELFVKAVKIQDLKNLEEQAAKLKEEIANPPPVTTKQEFEAALGMTPTAPQEKPTLH